MDTKSEVRDFLTSRRAKIAPGGVGLTSYGARQVPGLRREEVATLAGVSVDYYNRMERGSLAGVSEGVLEAVAGARRQRPDRRPAPQPGQADDPPEHRVADRRDDGRRRFRRQRPPGHTRRQ